MADVWVELLGLPKGACQATDNFFDLGGNSLLAMQAVERIDTSTGRRIQPHRFVNETLAQLALEDDTAPQVRVPRSTGLMGRVGGWLKRH